MATPLMTLGERFCPRRRSQFFSARFIRDGRANWKFLARQILVVPHPSAGAVDFLAIDGELVAREQRPSDCI